MHSPNEQTMLGGDDASRGKALTEPRLGGAPFQTAGDNASGPTSLAWLDARVMVVALAMQVIPMAWLAARTVALIPVRRAVDSRLWHPRKAQRRDFSRRRAPGAASEFAARPN